MAALGRWTSVDPLAEKHPEWSPYNYVLNNPMALLDPDGRQLSAQNVQEVFAGVDRATKGLTRVVEGGAALAGMKDFVQGTEEIGRGNVAGGLFLIGMSAPTPAGRGARLVRAADKAVEAADATGDLSRAVGDLVTDAAQEAPATIRELRAAGLKDAHHIIQDAAVRDLPGYSSLDASGIQLPGPANAAGTPHYRATQVQRQAGGGNYAAERRIAYKALRAAGLNREAARTAIARADATFVKIGVAPETPTRIPGTRGN